MSSGRNSIAQERSERILLARALERGFSSGSTDLVIDDVSGSVGWFEIKSPGLSQSRAEEWTDALEAGGFESRSLFQRKTGELTLAQVYSAVGFERVFLSVHYDEIVDDTVIDLGLLPVRSIETLAKEVFGPQAFVRTYVQEGPETGRLSSVAEVHYGFGSEEEKFEELVERHDLFLSRFRSEIPADQRRKFILTWVPVDADKA